MITKPLEAPVKPTRRRAWGLFSLRPLAVTSLHIVLQKWLSGAGVGMGVGMGVGAACFRAALWVVSHLQARSQDFTHYLLRTLHPIQFWHLPDQILNSPPLKTSLLN